MTPRLTTTSALAFAAALTLGSNAFAQVRSDTRIPVRKGEMPAPRTDTVVVRDTIRITSVDTVTVTRRDTVVQRVEVAPPPTPFGRFYWGLNGGAAFTTQDLNTTTNTGWTIGVLGGWDSYRAPLGVRLDAGYNRFDNDDDFFFNNVGGFDCRVDFGDGFDCDSDPQMWYINFNGKLRYPFRWDYRGAHVYLTGGATWNRFRRFAFVDDDFNFGDTQFIVLATDDWNTKWGGNVGGGVSFAWGNTSVYLESRYQTMNIGNTTQSYVPLVLGITF